MKQYFDIQTHQGRQILYFFNQLEKLSDGVGHVLELTEVANIDNLHESWEYVRMAGDFPVFVRKTV